MDTPSIIIIDDFVDNGLAFAKACVAKFQDANSFQWIRYSDNLPSTMIGSLPSHHPDADIIAMIEQGKNFFPTLDEEKVLEHLDSQSTPFIVLYDLLLGGSSHPKITDKLREIVNKSRTNEGPCVYVLLYSSSLKAMRERLKIDPTEKYAGSSGRQFDRDEDITELDYDEIAQRILEEAIEGWQKACPKNGNQEERASNWDFITWKALRSKALDICFSLGATSEVQSGLWAHHLPYGGDLWVEHFRDLIEPWTENLQQGLSEIASGVTSFPKHGWDDETDVNGVQAWARPPIRALAQFDREGRDLSAAFYLLKNDVRQITHNEIKIRFASSITMQPDKLEQDYLWFNVSALGQGLFDLAQSFKILVNRVRQGELKLAELPVRCVGGRIYWNIVEFNDGENFGLRIHVYQYLLGWSVTEEGQWAKWPCFMRYKFPLPKHDDARKGVKAAYEQFKRTGASIAIDDGALILELRAKRVEYEDNPNVIIWEVSG